MFIWIEDATRSVRLEDPNVFTTFHVRASNNVSGAEVAEALHRAGAGRAGDDDGHVLVRVRWLEEAAPAEESWRAGFSKMVEYATSKGWYDTASDSIRAHVEHV